MVTKTDELCGTPGRSSSVDLPANRNTQFPVVSFLYVIDNNISMRKETETKGAMANATSGADCVEIKVIVCEKKERAAEKAFALSRQKAEQRHVYYFDTPRLDLFNKGVVLRARKVEKAADDSTVKIRPVEPEKIPAKWHRTHGFKIEADGVGSRMVRSASLSSEQSRGEIDDVVRGRRPIEKLFSPDQEVFLSEMGTGKINMKELEIFGPFDATRWKVKHPGLPYQITIEDWNLPDGEDLIEVSIKAESAQAAAAAAAFTGFLTELGLKPAGGQKTKTRLVLESFSRSKLKKAG
jgi:hypothetical protein